MKSDEPIHASKPAKVAMIQCEGYGNPASIDIAENLSHNIELLELACKEHNPDLVLFPEMFTTPYFCGDHKHEYFDWAETIPGPTTERIAEKAVEHNCYIVVPIFERSVYGEYYDSAALIGPDGNIVEGLLSDGSRVKCYRKNHIPSIYAHTTRLDEKFYFRPGQGFPVFQTAFGLLGILICYDRSFPESFRSLVLQGADLILIPVASYGFRHQAFIRELQVRAMENGVFCAAANRGGVENLTFEVSFFGSSVAIDPRGEVIVQGEKDKGDVIISADLDLAQIVDARADLPYLRDRRPDIYIF